MDQVENECLATQEFQHNLHYGFNILTIFFFHLDSWKGRTKTFVEVFSNFMAQLKFTYGSGKKNILLFDLNVPLSNDQL